MKYKLIILAITITSFNTIFSQSKEVYIEYDFFFKDKLVENKQIKLRATDKESLSTTVRTIMVGINYNPKTGQSSERVPKTGYRYSYKNYKAQYLHYSEYIPGQRDKAYIKESLNQFNWQLTGKKKKVLGYNCQQATATYRGRDYIAYFTTQLPFKAAPWKFHGLPGVMLVVKTTDNKIKMEAQILKIQDKSEPIIDPFIKVKKFTPSWDAYKELYKKRLKRLIDKNISKLSSIKMSTEDRARIGIGVDLKVEIIVPENALSVDEQREARKLKN